MDTYTTKSQHTITIRKATLDDATNLLKLKKSYLAHTTTIPLYLHEYTNTMVEEQQWISKFISQQNSILFVAEYQGELIGNIDLSGNQRQKLFHTGVIGMGIHTQWQNQGIGTLLLQKTLGWAQQNKFLNLVWLEVYASNPSGIALYTKLGFKETGRIPNFFQENNQLIDKITMSVAL